MACSKTTLVPTQQPSGPLRLRARALWQYICWLVCWRGCGRQQKQRQYRWKLLRSEKAQISAECDPNEPSHYALIWASHLEVTRAELANWDAGARAWLAIADKANQRQHSQLRLIIENLSISVNNNSVVFSSVIKAWQSAMEMVQNLLMGISQRVNSGAVLLALSAWHHYPDMDVFCVSNKTVEQKDPLMSGAGRDSRP